MRGGMKLNFNNQSGIGNLWAVVIAAIAFAAGAGGMYVATSGLLVQDQQQEAAQSTTPCRPTNPKAVKYAGTGL